MEPRTGIILILLVVGDSQSAGAQPAADAHGDPLPASALVRLGTIRFQHGHSIEQIIYAQDGKRLAARDHSGCISIWAKAKKHKSRRTGRDAQLSNVQAVARVLGLRLELVEQDV